MAGGRGGYTCVHECGAEYSSDRGLTKHQTSCKTARKAWKADLKEAATDRETAKRRKLEAKAKAIDLGVLRPEPLRQVQVGDGNDQPRYRFTTDGTEYAQTDPGKLVSSSRRRSLQRRLTLDLGDGTAELGSR